MLRDSASGSCTVLLPNWVSAAGSALSSLVHTFLFLLQAICTKNNLALVSCSFLCVQRYTQDLCVSFGSPVTSGTAREGNTVEQSVLRTAGRTRR